MLVAHTGFEPVVSSLRGRCPRPLDECATRKIWYHTPCQPGNRWAAKWRAGQKRYYCHRGNRPLKYPLMLASCGGKAGWRRISYLSPVLVMVLLSLFPSFASSSRLQAVPLRGLGYGIISEPERRDLVADLGFSWVKHLVYWKDAQPQRGGPISFDPYDEWVDRARALGCNEIEIYSDSELLVRQLQGRYQVKHPVLRALHAKARDLIAGFRRFTVTHVPREENAEADALANRGIEEALRPVRRGARSDPGAPRSGGTG